MSRRRGRERRRKTESPPASDVHLGASGLLCSNLALPNLALKSGLHSKSVLTSHHLWLSEKHKTFLNLNFNFSLSVSPPPTPRVWCGDSVQDSVEDSVIPFNQGLATVRCWEGTSRQCWCFCFHPPSAPVAHQYTVSSPHSVSYPPSCRQYVENASFPFFSPKIICLQTNTKSTSRSPAWIPREGGLGRSKLVCWYS